MSIGRPFPEPTTFPEGFTLDAALFERTCAQCPSVDIKIEFWRFRECARIFGFTSLDWPSAWMLWARTAEQGIAPRGAVPL